MKILSFQHVVHKNRQSHIKLLALKDLKVDERAFEIGWCSLRFNLFKKSNGRTLQIPFRSELFVVMKRLETYFSDILGHFKRNRRVFKEIDKRVR